VASFANAPERCRFLARDRG